jgi:hypothetical protein
MRRIVAVIALTLSLCATPAQRSTDTLPAQIDDTTFWRMMNDMSEDAGYFRFQFMSNEREFPFVISQLRTMRGSASAYLGVGPEQNFTYIAAIHPKIAFVFDIRRENMIEHLIYKAIFELSANRHDFISKLFSASLPARVDNSTSVQGLFQAFSGSRSDADLFKKNLQAIKDRLMKDHRFALTAKDQASIDEIYGLIFNAGPGVGSLYGGFRGSNYADVVTSADENGVPQSFLASEENFQFVKELERKNLLIPLVGNFAGPKAIRAVATYLKEHHATVSAFYASNVEQYLFQQGDDWRRYYANVATLPMDAASNFIRSSHFAYDTRQQARRTYGGTNYIMLLCSMIELTKAFNAGKIASYDAVIRMSHD